MKRKKKDNYHDEGRGMAGDRVWKLWASMLITANGQRPAWSAFTGLSFLTGFCLTWKLSIAGGYCRSINLPTRVYQPHQNRTSHQNSNFCMFRLQGRTAYTEELHWWWSPELQASVTIWITMHGEERTSAALIEKKKSRINCFQSFTCRRQSYLRCDSVSLLRTDSE